VCRADNPQALCHDFKSDSCDEHGSYAQVQARALQDTKQFLRHFPLEVNREQPDNKGTVLWAAAEQGHVEAVCELLQHPHTDPNQVRSSSRTTPLFIASLRGHGKVVEVLLGHADVNVNLGAIESGTSPLCMAVQEGREGVVEMLLRHGSIKVNKAEKNTSVTPLCKASQIGFEHIVGLLLAVPGIDVHSKTRSGATPLSVATREGHSRIVEMLTTKIAASPNFTKTVTATFTRDPKGVLSNAEGNRDRERALESGPGQKSSDTTSKCNQAQSPLPVEILEAEHHDSTAT